LVDYNLIFVFVKTALHLIPGGAVHGKKDPLRPNDIGDWGARFEPGFGARSEMMEIVAM
jgi:hypothetical protein